MSQRQKRFHSHKFEEQKMDRRRLLKLSTAFGSACFLPGFGAKTEAKTVSKSENIEVLSVSDGSLRLPPSFALPNMPKADLEKVLGKVPDENAVIERPLNLTLLKTNDRTVLFDVGSGANFMQSAMQL